MAQSDKIQTRVLEMLAKKIGAGRQIDLDSSVIEDTGLDSVSVMDFVMELEDEFDITIPLDRIAEVRTVGDLAKAVQTMLHEGTGSREGAGDNGGVMEEGQ
jgi:acyl carrier protein